MRPAPRAALVLLAGGAGLLPAAPAVAAPRPGPAIVAEPTSGGPPTPLVWRTGLTLHGAAVDGTGARRLATVRGQAPTPAPDGRRIALIADDRVVTLDLDGSGTVRTLGRAPDATALRWSPDGRRIAAVGYGPLTVCGAGPGVPAGCRGTTVRAASEWGATWSPDSTRVAVVDDDGAVVTSDGARTSVLARYRVRRSRVDLPSPPVWTRAGLVWTTQVIRYEGGEFAGVGRASVRRYDGAGPRVLASVVPRGRTLQPFVAAGELPDGTLVGVRERFPRDDGSATAYDLRLLRPDGQLVDTAAKAGPFFPFRGTDQPANASAAVAGTLADGRVALVVRRSETSRAQLYLADPAGGLGRRIVAADEVAVATPFPGNPVG